MANAASDQGPEAAFAIGTRSETATNAHDKIRPKRIPTVFRLKHDADGMRRLRSNLACL